MSFPLLFERGLESHGVVSLNEVKDLVTIPGSHFNSTSLLVSDKRPAPSEAGSSTFIR